MLSPIRELLLTAKVCVALLHHGVMPYWSLMWFLVSYLSRTADCRPPLEVAWCLLVALRVVLSKGVSRSVAAQESLGPASKCMDLPSTSWGHSRRYVLQSLRQP